MYVKWRDHREGRIWMSTLGLKTFVEERLFEGLVCRDVEYLDERDQFLVSLILGDSIYCDRDRLSRELVQDLASLGVDGAVSWKRTSDEELEPQRRFFDRPWFWSALCASLAALWRLGPRGLIWCLLFGGLGYAGCIAVRSETGRGLYSRIARLFKEMID